MSSISAYMIWITDSDIYRNDIDQFKPTHYFKMFSKSMDEKNNVYLFHYVIYWFKNSRL